MNRRWTLPTLVLGLVHCGGETRSESETSNSPTGLSTLDGGVDSGDATETDASTQGDAETTTGDDPATDDSNDTQEDDSSSGGPPSDDPCDGADIICDGFEEGLTEQWAYTGNPNNMPVVDGSRAHTGANSLTFPSTDTQGAWVYPVAGLPTADNQIYVRAYINFERAMSEMGGHVSYIVGADQPANGVEMRLGASQNFGNGQMMIDVNLLGAGPEYTQFANGDVTGGAPSGADGLGLGSDTWYCMEAFYGPDEFRLWVDGEELMTMHVTDWQQGVAGWSPTYSVMKIGGQNYSGSLGQIWFDDVAMGSQPLGCP